MRKYLLLTLFKPFVKAEDNDLTNSVHIYIKQCPAFRSSKLSSCKASLPYLKILFPDIMIKRYRGEIVFFAADATAGINWLSHKSFANEYTRMQ